MTLSNVAQVAVLAARSAVADGRDVGPNTVAVLLAELERLEQRPRMVTEDMRRRAVDALDGCRHSGQPWFKLLANEVVEIALNAASSFRPSDEEAKPELRPFPMLDGPPIPWYVARAIYVHLYGPGEQTLDRIGERGGFGWGEVSLMWEDKAARRVSRRDRERCVRDIELGDLKSG